MNAWRWFRGNSKPICLLKHVDGKWHFENVFGGATVRDCNGYCLCDKTYSLQCDGGVLLIFTANIFFLSYSYDSHNSQSTFNSFQLSVISTTHKSYMHRMYRNYVSMIIMCMRYSVQQSSSCCCCWTITMMTRSKIIFIALHCIVIPPMLNFVLGKIFIIHFNLLE